METKIVILYIDTGFADCKYREEFDTGVPIDEWENMSAKEKESNMADVVNSYVGEHIDSGFIE